jgi:hypothetical protein
MSSSSLPRRAAIAAACLGATAALGAAPALAASQPGENIFGSGSSLQNIAQTQVWTGTWQSTPADHSTLSNNPFATYTSTSSGHGLSEWGNTTSALDLTQDVNADNGSTNGYGRPVLDAYIGSDDPPTSSNLSNAQTAATGSDPTPVQEITVPVAQAPVAVLFSLPTGITAGSGSVLKLTNTMLQNIWNRAIPKSGHYAANTWGALLEDAGWKRTATSPTTQHFTDAGGATGGTQAITLQVRSSGSGTSYTFKGFLNLSGDPLYTSAFVVDDPTWPVSVTAASNGGADEVNNTTINPGSVGYANLADAASASPAYGQHVLGTTNGGTHQILYALVQANQGSADPAQYANPEGSTAGTANVYTGNNINVNGANPSEVGSWNVPLNGTLLNATGTWGGTQASDPDVYDHSVTNGVKLLRYPIVAATYDIAWTKYEAPHSNIITQFGGTSADAKAAGQSAKSLLKYIITSSQGQADLANSGKFYARLPSKIDGFASTAVSKISP